MGFFSWAGSKVKSGYKKAKKTVHKAADKVKETVNIVVDKIKDTGSNMLSSFTGKKIAEQAKQIYQRAKQRYEEACSNFENKSKDIIVNINNCLQDINAYKKEIYENLLLKYKDITSKLYNVDISSKDVLDGEFTFSFNVEKMRAVSSVMKIDFEDHKFKSYLKAFISAGFWSRKEARESYEAAVEEEGKVNLNISKMNAELTRLEVVFKALDNVRGYFKDLIEIFNLLLDRLKYSLSYLRNLHLVFTYSFKKGRMDFRKLPKAQQKTFETTHTLVKILTSMCQRRYIDSETVSAVDAEFKDTTEEVKAQRFEERKASFA